MSSQKSTTVSSYNQAIRVSLEQKFAELLSSLDSRPRDDAQPRVARDHRLAHQMIASFLDNSGAELVKVLNGEVTYAALHQLEVLVSLFYSSLRDSYIGVDSHAPSRFLEVHPFLLESLAAADSDTSTSTSSLNGAHPECHIPRSVRIMCLSEDELRHDVQQYPGVAQDYFRQHEQSNIALLWVEPDFQKKARRELLRGEWTGDLGFWLNTCALLFQPSIETTEKELKLQLLYPDDSRFVAYRAYVARLIKGAKFVRLTDDDVTLEDISEQEREHFRWGLEAMFQPALAEVWGEFVAAPKRITKLGPFIKKHIDRVGGSDARVLDAAAGTGCESIYLLNRGYNVTSNEIVPRLIAHAEAEAREANVDLCMFRFDWRHLEHLAPADHFDLILALGNSMSCLSSASDVRSVLSRFAHLLRPGGLIVVDERNYPMMFRQERQMLLPRFRIPGNVVYCGRTIQARPQKYPQAIGADGSFMTLEYRRPEESEPVGTFKVLPFAENQLPTLLESAGFTDVELFYNLRRGQDGQDSEFLTYVARRRGKGTGNLPDETVLAFTDVTESSSTRRRLGDVAFNKEWETHKARVEAMAVACNGVISDDTGDGFVIEFADETSAIACMSDVTNDPGSNEFKVRSGVGIGPITHDERGKPTGALVNDVRRICDQARPAFVVVDDRIKLAADDHLWDPLGKISLRGVGHRVLWRLAH